jgi:hypothetical protein
MPYAALGWTNVQQRVESCLPLSLIPDHAETPNSTQWVVHMFVRLGLNERYILKIEVGNEEGLGIGRKLLDDVSTETTITLSWAEERRSGVSFTVYHCAGTIAEGDKFSGPTQPSDIEGGLTFEQARLSRIHDDQIQSRPVPVELGSARIIVGD